LLTGNPVRQAISHSNVTKAAGLQFFGLSESKKTVLVIGGSLGAKTINEAIDQNIAFFEANNLQLIWQTGKPYFEKATASVASHTDIVMKDFITNMEYAYAAADVIISRSGAMAVAEICLVQKPVIFVPYPFAAEDHQTANAKALVNKAAAMMVADSKASVELIPSLLKLLSDEHLQHTMQKNIAAFAIKNADEVIATEILKMIKKA
jgi:UDP-N-acetylglucosamine--N-acetylmuramyl-(pentapeptide) pyrophosphoryl-undecaprenol N-acetylglucosamine transferase